MVRSGLILISNVFVSMVNFGMDNLVLPVQEAESTIMENVVVLLANIGSTMSVLPLEIPNVELFPIQTGMEPTVFVNLDFQWLDSSVFVKALIWETNVIDVTTSPTLSSMPEFVNVKLDTMSSMDNV